MLSKSSRLDNEHIDPGFPDAPPLWTRLGVASPWRVASPELKWVMCLVSCQTHKSLIRQVLLSLLPSHLPDGDTEAREEMGLSRIPQPETVWKFQELTSWDSEF